MEAVCCFCSESAANTARNGWVAPQRARISASNAQSWSQPSFIFAAKQQRQHRSRHAPAANASTARPMLARNCVVFASDVLRYRPYRLTAVRRPEPDSFRGGHPASRRHPFKLHSITSVAATNRVVGNVMPRAFAVFSFSRNSIFVGSSTGRSAGFVPVRILFTKTPARRHIAT
jgi:hypothetical protein